MTREQLSKRELKELSKQLEDCGLICTFSKKDKAVKIDGKILSVNGGTDYFFHEGKIYPSLRHILDKGIADFRKITVDEGAIRFVTNGADVMRPGVVDIDDNISAGDFVVIVDKIHGKPLAVGLSLYSSDDMQKLEKGRVMKNIHHVGDVLWTMEI